MLRLDALIQSCPARYATLARDLVNKIRAPDSAQLLHRALSVVEEDLAALTDEVPCTPLQQYRNAAIACLKLMAQSQLLSDDSFVDPSHLACDPIYKAYLQASSNGPWERRTLRQALLYWLLLDSPSNEHLVALLEAIKHPPVLSCIDAPPTLTTTQLALIGEFFSYQADQSLESATVASILKDIQARILPYALAKDIFTISEGQKAALAATFSAASPPRTATPSETLRRLTIALNTRIGQSFRHLHRPAVDTLPNTHQVTDFLGWLQHTNPDLGHWAAINALLSIFSGPLLGAPKNSRFHLEGERYATHLHILAPDLDKRSPPPTGREWMEIQSLLQLPIPKRILQMASQLRRNNEYDYQTSKSRLDAAANTWRKNHGVSVKLGSIHKLFPTSLGQPASIDSTFLHLLGLAPITRRDAGIYYFSPSIPEIIRRYQQAIECVAMEIGQLDWLSDGWTDYPSQEHRFGASARPALHALVQLVTFLRNAMARPPGRAPLEDKIRRFNAEAAYLTVLFLASTGARPVEEVFPNSPHWAPDIQALLLSEKDSLLYRSTRRMPITEKLIQDFRAYTDRKHSLELQLGRRFDQRLTVFLLSNDGNPVAPTIANLKAIIPGFADHWPWSNDILRHHFRSRLWELGCDAWVLERAMGHLSKSQTPDTPYCMHRIADTLAPAKPYVAQLLDELGF